MIHTLSPTTIGAGLATVAAVCFAVQFLAIRVGTEDSAVADAVLVTLLCNVALVVPAVIILNWGQLSGLYTPTAVAAFGAAGVVGLGLARVFLFRSVKLIGASRTSPVAATNVLFATAFAAVVLGERVAPLHLVGIVLVVGGIALLSWETASAEQPGSGSMSSSAIDLAYPLAAAVLIGAEPVLVSIGLAEGTRVIPGLAVMILSATLSYAAYWAVSRSDRTLRGSNGALRWYVVAGVAATGGFVSYLLALELTSVVVVMPILQTNPLLVTLLSAVFLPRHLERVTARLVLAACVIVVGATVVSVVG